MPCRAHAAATQQVSDLQQALLALQASLHADKLKYQKIKAALAVQKPEDGNRQQQEQEQQDNKKRQPAVKRQQGKCLEAAWQVGTYTSCSAYCVLLLVLLGSVRHVPACGVTITQRRRRQLEPKRHDTSC